MFKNSVNNKYFKVISYMFLFFILVFSSSCIIHDALTTDATVSDLKKAYGDVGGDSASNHDKDKDGEKKQLSSCVVSDEIPINNEDTYVVYCISYTDVSLADELESLCNNYSINTPDNPDYGTTFKREIPCESEESIGYCTTNLDEFETLKYYVTNYDIDTARSDCEKMSGTWTSLIE